MLPSSPDGRMIDILIWTFEIEATNKNVPSIHRYGFGWCLHIESWDHQCRCCHLRQDPSMGYHGCVEVCDTDRCRWILCVRHIVVPCMGCWLLYCLGSVSHVWVLTIVLFGFCVPCMGADYCIVWVLCPMYGALTIVLFGFCAPCMGCRPAIQSEMRVWWQ